ncbi:MAG: amidase [Verrucomicrobia bacterium]|nr:amidase [Verrucomicrobiota bacterium]
MINDPVFSTITQWADALRTRRISACEALQIHLARIDQYNPALNAINIIDAEKALERARSADEAVARGELWGPLHGIPFTLKDAHCTAGMRTTVGFPPFAGYVPEEDSAVAARLKLAGGILMGKTNVAMMLGDYQTNNPLFGRTNNPWDVHRTSGGSSGGAAAALAAGMTPFEVGTDLSCSIRIPAHFCGVFGLKPTERRVPLTGLIPNPQNQPRPIRIMSSIGPMARSVEDLQLIYSVIAGPDGRDTDLQPVPQIRIKEPAPKELRIALAPTFPGFPVAADIRSAIETAAAELEKAGAIVEEAELPAVDFQADLSRAGELIGMMLGTVQPESQEKPVTVAQYFKALAQRDESILAWEQFFESWDALLCPPAMVTAFPHCEPGADLQLDGTPVSYWLVSAHGALFNYTGHPAVVLPCKLDRNGLPIGLQLVGRRWNEAHLLGVAKAVSGITGQFRRPPIGVA